MSADESHPRGRWSQKDLFEPAADAPAWSVFSSVGDGPEPPDRVPSPRIRVSARARRLSVRVYPDARIEVVVPRRARPKEIEHFLAAHREWIAEKRALALRNRPLPAPFPPPHIELAATRECLRLHFAGGARLRITELDAGDASGGVLAIGGAPQGAGLRRALRAWLKRAAAARLEPRVRTLAAVTGLRHSRVSIRLQRSRWGSCSARGTISLNACLLFQRPEVVDYLILHELTHLKHMNHSARFWSAVARHCAGWRALDRELLGGWRHVPRWVFAED